jgi:hypothetical protein
VNKIIPLSDFTNSGSVQEVSNIVDTSSIYPTFELNSIPQDLEYDDLNVDIKALKDKNDSFVVDIKPAETNLFYYYVWVMVTVVLIGLIYFSLTSSNSGTINMIILLIIVISAVFIIREYI